MTLPASPSPSRSAFGKAVAAAAVLLLALAGSAQAANDITPAEHALFIEPSLSGLKPPQVLRYHFHRGGAAGNTFDDSVTLNLKPLPGNACCAATVDFLTGARKVKLPEIDLAEANPVLLGFLEHDIQEMERATGGKANYFRKRIRMALAGAPALLPRTLRYQGKDVAGTEISITPYADDPLRARYEALAGKRYQFWRSAAVPGRLFGIRTVVPVAAAPAAVSASAAATAATTPVTATAGTELWLAGAEPVAP